MKDFPRSLPVTYTVNAVISRKRCKMESLLEKTTNRKSYNGLSSSDNSDDLEAYSFTASLLKCDFRTAVQQLTFQVALCVVRSFCDSWASGLRRKRNSDVTHGAGVSHADYFQPSEVLSSTDGWERVTAVTLRQPLTHFTPRTWTFLTLMICTLQLIATVFRSYASTNDRVNFVKLKYLWHKIIYDAQFFFPDCLHGPLPGPFLLSYSVVDFIFSLFVVSGPCARLSWPSHQLLSAD